jgi:hypothetical protein
MICFNGRGSFRELFSGIAYRDKYGLRRVVIFVATQFFTHIFDKFTEKTKYSKKQ